MSNPLDRYRDSDGWLSPSQIDKANEELSGSERQEAKEKGSQQVWETFNRTDEDRK